MDEERWFKIATRAAALIILVSAVALVASAFAYMIIDIWRAIL